MLIPGVKKGTASVVKIVFFIGVGGTITIDTFYDNESLEKAASNHRLASRLLILQ